MAPATPSPAAQPVLPRGLTILLGLAAAVIVVAGLRSMAGIVAPVSLALVITITVQPMRSWFSRHLPRWASTLLCVVTVNAILLGLAVALTVAAARFATLLVGYEDKFNARISDLTDHLHQAGVSSDHITTLTNGLDLSKLTDVVTSVLSGAAGVLSGLLFIVALIFFMTLDGSTMPHYLAEAASVRPRIVGALAQFARATRRYLLVSTVFGFAVAVLDTVALEVMGVPAPLLWGLVAFLTNYIPNIGFLIGLVPPATLALLDAGVGEMVAVIVVYCVLNLVIQSGIQPRVVGGAVGLSTTLTFVSLVLWSWILGPLGAILAVPMSLLVRAVLVDSDPDNAWLRPLVANRSDSAEDPERAKRPRRARRRRHSGHAGHGNRAPD